MALMKLEQFRKTFFVKGSEPSVNNIKEWIDNGEVYGRKIGSLYYIDADDFLDYEPEPDELVLKVLSHDAQTQKAR